MENEFNILVGLRIREFRTIKGLKQYQLADLLNMERSNLTRIETGKQRPTDENIKKIAQILGVEVQDLYNFNHLKTKSELLEIISDELKSCTEKEVQYIYKTIRNIKLLRKK